MYFRYTAVLCILKYSYMVYASIESLNASIETLNKLKYVLEVP